MQGNSFCSPQNEKQYTAKGHQKQSTNGVLQSYVGEGVGVLHGSKP